MQGPPWDDESYYDSDGDSNATQADDHSDAAMNDVMDDGYGGYHPDDVYGFVPWDDFVVFYTNEDADAGAPALVDDDGAKENDMIVFSGARGGFLPGRGKLR